MRYEGMTAHPFGAHETEVDRKYERKLHNYTAPDEIPFSFDDVPAWVTTYYRGRQWLVADKADNLSPVEGRHLDLGALDRVEPGRAIIHETWVNKWLHDRTNIHFNWWESGDY